jgi:spermidine/putrescine-binding protein
MMWISALLIGLLMLFAGETVFSQDNKLIEAAKKEGGKVIVYTSMETFTADAIKAAFEKKTGLQMEYWRGGSTEVLDRSLAEFRVGKPLFDVVAMTGDHMHLLAKEGEFVNMNRLRSKASLKTRLTRISELVTETCSTG